MYGGLLPQFLCLLLNGSPSVLGQINRLCSGSTRDFLNQEILKTLLLPLPPFEEQVQIVQIVDERLSSIEHLEEQVEANLRRASRLRQGILKRAFEGKLVPQDPADEPADRLLKRIRESRQGASGPNGGRKVARPRQVRACRVHSDRPLFPTAGAGEPEGGAA
jgi:type I restriction enzyme S subunit